MPKALEDALKRLSQECATPGINLKDVEGHPEQYLTLVATKLIRCIDEKASQVQLWRPEDGLPEKVGKYYSVDGMRVDKSKIGNAKVLRTEGWDIALIVSEDIKDALERIGATGTRFTEV